MDKTQLAKLFYHHSRSELGEDSDAWTLAKRLAEYLHHAIINEDEEIAFSIVDDDLVGVARFLKDVPGPEGGMAMISIEQGSLPEDIWKRLQQLGSQKFVHCDPEWD